MTIIEIIVAMFLIFVMFVVYLAALNTVKLIKQNNYADTAYHIATAQIETIRSSNFDALTNVTNASITDPLLAKLPSGAGTYSISDSATMSGLKQIEVTVTWNDGNPKSVDIQTLAGNGGINP